jgi:hypothetical protein
MDNIATAATCNTRLEAEMIKSLLESAGIESFVTADDVGGLYSFRFGLSGSGSAQVLVKAADVKAAQQIIAAARQE